MEEPIKAPGKQSWSEWEARGLGRSEIQCLYYKYVVFRVEMQGMQPLGNPRVVQEDTPHTTCKSRRGCFWRLRDRWQERAVPFIPFVTRSLESLRKEGYKGIGYSGAAFGKAGHQQSGACSVPQEGRRCFWAGPRCSTRQGQLKAHLGKGRARGWGKTEAGLPMAAATHWNTRKLAMSLTPRICSP